MPNTAVVEVTYPVVPRSSDPPEKILKVQLGSLTARVSCDEPPLPLVKVAAVLVVAVDWAPDVPQAEHMEWGFTALLKMTVMTSPFSGLPLALAELRVVGVMLNVNWSGPEAPEVPLAFVTLTSTGVEVGEVIAGVVAVICVSEFTVNDAAAVLPNLTPVEATVERKPLPEMVTVVPPALVPDVGLTPVTIGVVS